MIVFIKRIFVLFILINISLAVNQVNGKNINWEFISPPLLISEDISDGKIYSVQLSSISDDQDEYKIFKNFKEKLPDDFKSLLRVEHHPPYYTLRLGIYDDYKQAKDVSAKLLKSNIKNYIISPNKNPRWILYPHMPKKAQNEDKKISTIDNLKNIDIQKSKKVTSSNSSQLQKSPKNAWQAISGQVVKPHIIDNLNERQDFKTLDLARKYLLELLAIFILLSLWLAYRKYYRQRNKKYPEKTIKNSVFSDKKQNFANKDKPDSFLPSLNEKMELELQKNISQLASVQSNILEQGKKIKSIYVTSCFNGEGKTRTSIYLAHGLSLNSSKVLLIDGNPRSSQLHSYYNFQNEMGFVNFLQGEARINDIIWQTKYSGLSIVFFGKTPDKRPDFLTKNIVSDCLDLLKKEYDFIIMDGHSQVDSSDSPLIASLFEGTLFAVESEKTKWEILKSCSQKITFLGGKNLGIVLCKRKFYIPNFIYKWI